jgi:hypothetical protein
MATLSEKVKGLTIEMARIHEPLSRHHIVMLYATTAIMALSEHTSTEIDINAIKDAARHAATIKKRYQFSGSRTQIDSALDELKSLTENILEKYN